MAAAIAAMFPRWEQIVYTSPQTAPVHVPRSVELHMFLTQIARYRSKALGRKRYELVPVLIDLRHCTIVRIVEWLDEEEQQWRRRHKTAMTALSTK